MKLTKHHRETLLTELIKAKDEQALFTQGKNPTEDFIKWCEIKMFLLSKRIELIEQSLIDNEIDY